MADVQESDKRNRSAGVRGWGQAGGGSAEDALLESEQRFRRLVEQAPLSIQILSPDGRTVKVNPAWEKLWGTTAEEIGDYNILEDQQLEERGVLTYIRRAFQG